MTMSGREDEAKKDVEAMAAAMKKAPTAGKHAGAATSNQDDATNEYSTIKMDEWCGDHAAFDRMAKSMRSGVFDAATRGLIARYEREHGEDRWRAWSCILYPESMNPKALQILEEAGCQAAVSPLHDRDKWEDGSPKKPHFHVILYWTGKKSYAQVLAVCKRIGATAPILVESLPGMCRYLCHMDIDPEHIPADRGKVRYDPKDVVTIGGFDYRANCRATETDIGKAVAILENLCREQAEHGEPFDSYAAYKDFIAKNRPELFYLACVTQVSTQLSRYIHSAARAREMKAKAERAELDLELMRERIDGQDKQIKMLVRLIAGECEGE